MAPTHNKPPSDKAAQPGVGAAGPTVARSQAYLFLGRTFAFPSQAFFDDVTGGRWQEQATGFLPQLPFPVPPLGGGPPTVSRDDFQAEYNRLFEVGASGRAALPPVRRPLRPRPHAGDGGAHPLLQLLRPRPGAGPAPRPHHRRAGVHALPHLQGGGGPAERRAARNPTSGPRRTSWTAIWASGCRCCTRSSPSASRCPSSTDWSPGPKISWGGTVNTSSPCSIPPPSSTWRRLG